MLSPLLPSLVFIGLSRAVLTEWRHPLRHLEHSRHLRPPISWVAESIETFHVLMLSWLPPSFCASHCHDSVHVPPASPRSTG
ncbi:uncharacterized protein LMH87_009149 [Akanthomyces muscarius]|uniref:Secreted protein n=1 Tax=Akanthomyces muscarius TaxID=2231603 RepID=A0A9W8UQC7_AKAMU|nr:uncharacterized protein LMH87_009149 [Akanthomyces muscarius]KAJ4158633.1 hypothetical protein LMH87_009149 [Akanthomyces muscarius]